MSKNVFRDTVILTYTRIIVIGTNLVYSMVLTRALSQYDYGVYSQAQIIITFAITFLGLSIPNCVNFFLPQARGKEEENNVIINIMTMCLMVGLTGAIIIVGSAPLLASFFHQQELKKILMVGAFIPCSQLFSNVFDNTFIVMNRATMVGVRRTVISFLKVVAVVILWALKLSFIEFYFCIALIELVVGLYSAVCVLRAWKGERIKRINFKFLKKALYFALPLGLSGIVGTLNINVGKLIISKQFGPEELALYSNMTQELPITIIATSVAAVGVPLVAKYLAENRTISVLTLWRQTTELSVILTSWAVGVLIVMAPEAVTFLYSQKYISGVPIFRIASIILLLRTVYFGMILNGSGNTKGILYNSIIGMAVNVGLLVLLYPTLHILAPVCSSLIASFIMGWFQLKASAKVLRCTMWEIFPWKAIIKNLMFNGIIGCICLFVASFLRVCLQSSFLLLAIIGSLWFALLLLCSGKRALELKKVLSGNLEERD